MRGRELLFKQLRVGKAGAAVAAKAFLDIPLWWKPATSTLQALEKEGYWPWMVVELVPVFIIWAKEQGLLIQHLDACFDAFVRNRLPQDPGGDDVDVSFVLYALRQKGYAGLYANKLTSLLALFSSDPVSRDDRTGTINKSFFAFCVKRSWLLMQ